jgi:hypothetical protein
MVLVALSFQISQLIVTLVDKWGRKRGGQWIITDSFGHAVTNQNGIGCRNTKATDLFSEAFGTVHLLDRGGPGRGGTSRGWSGRGRGRRYQQRQRPFAGTFSSSCPENISTKCPH